MRPVLVCAVGALLASGRSLALEGPPQHYQPKRRVPPSLEPILRHLDPGHDAFPEEKEAQELAERLQALSRILREKRPRDAVDLLLAPEFKGGCLTPAGEVSGGSRGSVEVFRPRAASGRDPSPAPADALRDRSAFGEELVALVAEFESVEVAELLITAIEVKRDAGALVRTEVRYDIVGPGRQAWRGERVGRWQMQWRRGTDGAWRVVEWTALEQLRSRAEAPVFVETTAGALGGNPSFRRQLVPRLDDWVARLDGVFVAGGAGHHGVSVGDADGDGLDDLYVSQPAGLPNRLFRNRGDGTFDDVTEAAGVGVLDSTSQAIFADVDNDGDEDLVLVTRAGLLLFLNDGKGHFTSVPDAFRFKGGGLRGSPTSVTMADYDRDGFLDLYVCTYAYFIGASEDKAATPTPYHDAENGPPNVLLRNDGRGHFVDVTSEVGLDENNHRFSFAAAWADYDEDGWPDLLVANDFGRKNLYHNEGLKNGRVTFRDVAASAGVEDWGAGMSAAWLDYDNDGHLDIYTGNMWSAAGQRVTGEPGFMPDATPEVRGLYRRHARGNSLFRNRGDGTFENVTGKARAAMGRWAWSSDALDFDNDGWEDLFVVNGMFTQETREGSVDFDSFFWRQVVARSPLANHPGTPYEDGWRAINRLLMANGEQASHERGVFLRNDGRGGFDEVSGSVGLDVEQDGRSFAVLDYDGDGRADVVTLAPRSSPQLRLFRNQVAAENGALALRLTGTRSNRDAVGARVTIETVEGRRTKIVHAGSGFLSQHSKELLFGLGKSPRIVKVEIRWPSGLAQTLTDLPLNHRVSIVEGSDAVLAEPFRKGAERSPPAARPAEASEPSTAGTWMYRPFPAPDFTLRDLEGRDHALAALRGKPVVVLFWATVAPSSFATLQGLAQQSEAFRAAGVPVLAVAVDPSGEEPKVRAAVQGLGVPVMMATEEMAGAYSVLSRYLFDRREDLRLPTVLLIDGRGDIVEIFRDRILPAQILADVPRVEASPAERLARALPFAGTFYAAPGERNYFQYSLDLAEQGYDGPALAAFERTAKLDPIPITLYNLGTLYAKAGKASAAQDAFERALRIQPDYADAGNSLGAILAQSGDVPGAIARFRAALKAKPDFPDALNNLGYALFQTGRENEAHDLYEKALSLQPDFPEAFNNLGIFFGQQGELDRAERFFRQAVEGRPEYGEAGNNLALVLAARGDAPGAIVLLQRLLERNPGFEMTYVTLSKVYLNTGRRREGIQVLELLLQRNPKHPLALQLLRQVRGGD